MESRSTPPETPARPDDRIPRGAIIIVVIGLIATVAAVLLTTETGSGEAAHLEWVQQRAVPDSKPVAIPGSKKAKMQFVEGKIQATGTNAAGYSLFRVLTTLRIDENAPIGHGRILCSVHATKRGTEIAQSTGGLRATYPRSSEKGIYAQEAPEKVTMQKFASHGVELAYLEVGDIKHARFATIQGVKLAWPKYQKGTEHLEYFLPNGKNKPTISLPFYTIWKTAEPPVAKVACTLEVASGKATVATEASLPKMPPPINEEEEAENLKEKEEAEAEAGEEPSSEESKPTGE
jgi:hypothetical protein